MIVSRIVVGPLGTNCYIVKNEQTGKGFVVDPGSGAEKILADIVKSGDTVILTIPIDEAAPKGRLILPQQQVLRELLINSINNS